MEKNSWLEKTDPLLDAVCRTIGRHAMVAPESAVLVGVSGGPDSVALLHALVRLQPELAVARVGVAHVHHGLRGAEADADLAFVASLAAGLGLPFYTEKIDVAAAARNTGASVEDAARTARYRFFQDTAAAHGYQKIATAHHANDNAEWVLMNLVRGAGPDGLSGIPPVRDNIIRPLIHVSRDDILAFLTHGGMDYVEDSTNADLTFTRNRVRHHLLPLLEEQYNPGIAASLNRVAEIFRDESLWIRDMVSGLFEQAVLLREPGRVVLKAGVVRALPLAARRRLVRRVLEIVKGDLRRITFDHVETVCRGVGRAFGLDLPDAVHVSGNEQELVFTDTAVCPATATPQVKPFSYTLFDTGLGNGSVTIAETGVTLGFALAPCAPPAKLQHNDRRTALLDAEKLTCPLTVRNVRPGDRFVPLGMTGSQKVSDFFINTRVAPEDRAACPVVESGGAIVWVAGHRMAEHVKLTPASRQVLEARIF